MTHPVAIKIENLGKRYRYSGAAALSSNLRADIGDWVKSLLQPDHRSHPSLHEVHEKRLDESPEYFWALKDVSFEIKRGDVVGIIGRNGAGKSTLLKILSRITPPTTGTITYHGRVSSLLEVGTGFHRELTGRENVFLNGSILGMKRSEIARRFDEIVAFAEVEKFLDTPVKFYSSGMYVRLAFAVAAHLEPEILIVDEVLAVGDAAFQKKCLGKMGDVAKQGRTILFVSHNMSAIVGLCRSALLLEKGRAVMAGGVRDVVNQYTSTVASASTVDLSSLEHGGPGEFAKLTKLSVFNAAHNPCNTFAMGHPIVIRLDLRCKRAMADVEVGVRVSSMAGIAIHYYTTSWEGVHCDLKEGEHSFEMVAPQVMLLPGKYLLSAWVLREGNVADDKVMEITTIEVVGSDVNGHAARFDKYAFSGCEVYAPSQWRMVEARSEQIK